LALSSRPSSVTMVVSLITLPLGLSSSLMVFSCACLAHIPPHRMAKLNA
jgi:hypothetical protein